VDRFLLHNDEIRETGERGLSPGQVGLLNGWGVFSTLRIYDGVPFAWERHWDRMKNDAARMRVPFPEDAGWLEANLLRLIEANQALNATMRVVVVRNRGGLYEGPSLRRDFDVIAFTADLKAWGDGARLGVVPHARHAASEFAGAKILSWSENLTRYERAREQGFDEVVLLNERGEVAECTSANLFIVQGSHVWTPPLTSGCLPGVTRAILLEIALENVRVNEKPIFPSDFETADEVFISSTTREVLPVISMAGYSLKPGLHPVRDLLQNAFSEYVQAYVALQRRPAGALK
jgi:branched-chain amino acid aminotransferase